jgi:hypothetical protein
MYAMIVVNTHKPGNSPGVTEYLSLNGLGWNGSTAIPFAFWKQFRQALQAEDLSNLVLQDMEIAATNPMWESFQYKVVSCSSQPM